MEKKYWKSQGILLVRKSGNHGQFRILIGRDVNERKNLHAPSL